MLLVIIGIALATGNNDLIGQVLGGAPTGGNNLNAPAGSDVDVSHCKTGADANKYVDCRVVATMNSLNSVWTRQAPKLGVNYKQPGLDLFRDNVNTRCGPATSAIGPFYCPADNFVYIDTGFFDVLVNKFGSSSGAFAQEYVVAHEVGHHISTQIGSIAQAQRDPKGPQSGAVRVELQADCFAGVWAHHAANTPEPGSAKPLLKPLTQQDINDALSAAAAVGDDRIQEKIQGRVNPETFTHGTAAQRQKWFSTGYRTGDPTSCDTFRGNV